MTKSKSQEKINRKKTAPHNASHPSTAVNASTSFVHSCYHPGHMANNAIKKYNAISQNNCRGTKSLSRPCKPDSVSTSVHIATQRSLQESIFAMPKIPKKKGKAASGGGSANVNLGDEDSGNGGVGGSSVGSVMGATTRERAKGE